jgi:hypothetical protein
MIRVAERREHLAPLPLQTSRRTEVRLCGKKTDGNSPSDIITASFLKQLREQTEFVAELTAGRYKTSTTTEHKFQNIIFARDKLYNSHTFLILTLDNGSFVVVLCTQRS